MLDAVSTGLHPSAVVGQLAETGFEYVTGEYTDGGKIFRKRK
jgi:hypothetical protein